MTEVFFHCSDDAEHVLIDRRGVAMGLAEAHRHLLEQSLAESNG